MMMPKRVKHRKVQKGCRAGNATRNNQLDFGEYGLQVLDRGFVSGHQIEAARVAVTRHLKRRGQLWLRIFPDKPITKKPAETRMGKGKGAPDQWVVVIRPGKILFEMEGVPLATATEALRLAMAKLGVRTKMVTRTEIAN